MLTIQQQRLGTRRGGKLGGKAKKLVSPFMRALPQFAANFRVLLLQATPVGLSCNWIRAILWNHIIRFVSETIMAWQTLQRVDGQSESEYLFGQFQIRCGRDKKALQARRLGKRLMEYLVDIGDPTPWDVRKQHYSFCPLTRRLSLI